MLVTKSQVKYIQSLGHKKFRDEEGLFVVEGPKIVAELLSISRLRVRQIYAVKEWAAMGLSRAASRAAVDLPIQVVSEPDLKRLSSLTTPNEVVAIFEKPSFPGTSFERGISLVLDGVQDPGNLGTIVRIADWFGIARVLCSPDCADVFNTKAIQSTMGSISRVPVLYGDPVAILREHPGAPVYAALLEGKEVYGMPRIRKGFVMIGNESKGIRPALADLATDRITIPRFGQAESLNAGVATGIILSHLVAGKGG